MRSVGGFEMGRTNRAIARFLTVKTKTWKRESEDHLSLVESGLG